MTKPPKDSDSSNEAPRASDADSRIARLEKALAQALERSAATEARLVDQQARLEALGQGREESMRALTEARAALRQANIERDEARKQLARIDSMQTATITLPDEDSNGGGAAPTPLPSIEDLMAGLGEMRESGPKQAAAGHLHVRVQAADTDRSEEMLSPEVVFPEEYAQTAQSAGAGEARTARILVLLDGEKPIKYPLYKDDMTIGRADSADIQINSTFISRLHARVLSTGTEVSVEDIGSKNGIKVNSKLAQRHTLHHGDVIGIGPLRFRFLDTTADDGG